MKNSRKNEKTEPKNNKKKWNEQSNRSGQYALFQLFELFSSKKIRRMCIIFLRLFCQFKNSFYLCIRKRKKIRMHERKRSSRPGPFVYRLGRKIFILERGVRFPQRLLIITIKKQISRNGKSQIITEKNQTREDKKTSQQILW